MINTGAITAVLWSVALLGVLYGCYYTNYTRLFLWLPAGCMLVIWVFVRVSRRHNGH